MIGHEGIHVPAQFDKPGEDSNTLRGVREVVRVEWDAVPADSRARPESHEPIGFG